jgi:hypothetical protein
MTVHVGVLSSVGNGVSDSVALTVAAAGGVRDTLATTTARVAVGSKGEVSSGRRQPDTPSRRTVQRAMLAAARNHRIEPNVQS